MSQGRIVPEDDSGQAANVHSLEKAMVCLKANHCESFWACMEVFILTLRLGGNMLCFVAEKTLREHTARFCSGRGVVQFFSKGDCIL